MAKKSKKANDVLGIRPIGSAINTVAKGTVDGTAALLSRICLPAAEELGLLLRDKVSNWRAKNFAAIAKKTDEILTEQGKVNHQAHPRIVQTAVDKGSWVDDENIRNMWAGLLASSCTEDGDDDGNLIFMILLSQLSRSEARILNYACQNSPKIVSGVDFVVATQLSLSGDEVQKITGVTDIQRMHREFGHLVSLDLLTEGIIGSSSAADMRMGQDISSITDIKDTVAWVTPTGLAIHLYVRCEGSSETPTNFFFRKEKYWKGE